MNSSKCWTARQRRHSACPCWRSRRTGAEAGGRFGSVRSTTRHRPAQAAAARHDGLARPDRLRDGLRHRVHSGADDPDADRVQDRVQDRDGERHSHGVRPGDLTEMQTQYRTDYKTQTTPVTRTVFDQIPTTQMQTRVQDGVQDRDRACHADRRRSGPDDADADAVSNGVQDAGRSRSHGRCRRS